MDKMKNLRKISFLASIFVLTLFVQGCSQREPQVKNIIFLIGDGMGVAHITMASIEQDYEPLAMERAEYVGLAKTHSADDKITDSAAAGTALATGHKTTNGTIGMDAQGNLLVSTRKLAEEAGYATGVVVSSFVVCATPASFVAHVPKRSQYEAIAKQYLEHDIDLFFGGGRNYFENRTDSIDLIIQLKDKGYVVASELEELNDIYSGKVALLNSPEMLPYSAEGRGNFLPEATEKALEILTANSEKGFFLMVEGSRIDHAAHWHDSKNVLAEVQDFDRAVEIAFNYADTHKGTLVIVTADHETGGLTMIKDEKTSDLENKPTIPHYSTGGHSASMVPIFAYGEGAEKFSGVMDNTDIAKIMQQLIGVN